MKLKIFNKNIVVNECDLIDNMVNMGLFQPIYNGVKERLIN
jgi:hypothetical protein